MKRLALLFALLILVASTLLGSGGSEVLLAPDGSVFSVDVVSGVALPEGTTAMTALRLRVARGEDEVTHFVPASLEGGRNWNAALAYDSKTATLFIFWVRAPQITTSELLICSFKDGAFGEPTVLDGGLFRYREHLQIAMTRFALDETADALAEAVAIHAMWWDTDGWDERARYALLQIVDGRAVIVDLRNAVDLLAGARNPTPADVDPAFDPKVLTFPTVTAGARLERADVTFGDRATNRIYRADVIPVIANGVLKPPIGISRGEVPAPVFAVANADSSIATLTHPVDGRGILLYTMEGSKVRYIVFENETWTTFKPIVLDEHVSEAAAIDALKRRLADR